MHKRFILLLGVFLGAYAPTPAQTPAPQIAAAQKSVPTIVTLVRTLPTLPLLGPSFPLLESHRKSAAPFSYMLASVYPRQDSLASLSPVREVKTLFLTQSILPLVNVWGGRLRLAGFSSTLDMKNVQLGPSMAGGLLDYRPPRPSYPGGPRSVGLYGANLTFHFGRDAQTGRPDQIWRALARIARAAR